MRRNKKLHNRHLEISSEVYDLAQEYSRRIGMPLKTFAEKAMRYCVEERAGRQWLLKFLDDSPTSPVHHDLSSDVQRQEIKEMTKPAIVVHPVAEDIAVEDILKDLL